MTKYKDLPNDFTWKKWKDKYPNPKAENGILKYHQKKPEEEKGVLYHILKQADRKTVEMILDDIFGK